MAYVKVDNNFFSHTKVLRVPVAAKALYIAALCYANQHLTDGKIEDISLVLILPLVGAKQKDVESLVAVGLWHREAFGYVIHDYTEYQTCADKIDKKRKDNADRQTRYRDSLKNGHKESNNSVSNALRNGHSNGVSNGEIKEEETEEEKEEEAAKPPTPIQTEAGRHYPPSLSKEEIFIADTLQANPHWQAEYDKRMLNARNPVALGVTVLREWTARPETAPKPPPPPQKIHYVSARDHVNYNPNRKPDPASQRVLS